MRLDSANVAAPVVCRSLSIAKFLRYREVLRFLAPLILLVLALVSLRSEAQGTAGNPAIAITATPDPVRPGELVQYVITATNRSAVGHSFRVSAQVPNHTTVAAGGIANPPSISQGGGCGGGVSTCPAGSTISWDFGNNAVAPGQSVTVQFSALVDTTNPPPSGTVIRSTASVVSSGIDSATAGVDVVVSSAGLSLGMVNASSPVAPGAALSYTLEFGNPGAVSAPAATLAVALPAGTSFVSATGGGALVGSTVQWDVGALPSGGTGQRQLVVQVDPAAASGSVVSAAADLRDAGTGASLARANAAAVVLTSAGAQVMITATPDPVRPGELVQYAITATNRSAVPHSFSVSAQVPNHTTVSNGAFSVPTGISQGGSCGSSAITTCAAGSTISWLFGNNPIAPGQSVTVQFSALVDTINPPPSGTVIRSTASVVSSGIDSASAGVDVAIQGGASSAPVLSTDPVTLGFGSVQVGSSRDLAMTVTNTGAGTLTGTAAPSASFSVVSGSPFSLGAGRSQAVTVRFSPSAALTFGGQLNRDCSLEVFKAF